MQATTKGKLRSVAVKTKADDKNNIITILELKIEVEEDKEGAHKFLEQNGSMVQVDCSTLQLTLGMKIK